MPNNPHHPYQLPDCQRHRHHEPLKKCHILFSPGAKNSIQMAGQGDYTGYQPSCTLSPWMATPRSLVFSY